MDDADRWVTAFRAAFPDADWVAIGLPRMPGTPDSWAAHGLDLELDEVLTTRSLPQGAPLPAGYSVRRLSGADWDQALARTIAANDRSGEQDPTSFDSFARGQVRTRQDLSGVTSRPGSARSRTAHWSRTSGSCGAAAPRGTRTSARTSRTGGADWPHTCSAWRHAGPPTVAATRG